MELTALKAARVEMVTVGSGCGRRMVLVASLVFQDRSCGSAPLNMPLIESKASRVLMVTSGGPFSLVGLLLHAQLFAQPIKRGCCIGEQVESDSVPFCFPEQSHTDSELHYNTANEFCMV